METREERTDWEREALKLLTPLEVEELGRRLTERRVKREYCPELWVNRIAAAILRDQGRAPEVQP